MNMPELVGVQSASFSIRNASADDCYIRSHRAHIARNPQIRSVSPFVGPAGYSQIHPMSQTAERRRLFHLRRHCKTSLQ